MTDRKVTVWSGNITEIRSVDDKGNVTKVMLDNYGENANVPHGTTWTPGTVRK